ncbi:MAG: deoxyribodipyrimidine photo-lyase [Paludibacter sp.]|nr:deoxyribodipyrimidine photo-lyase [Paludibacter sp.]
MKHINITTTDHSIKTSITICWFRRDLRLHDNKGLFEALNNHASVLPIFIFDTEILSKLSDKKDKRVSFIHHALIKLQDELIKEGSSLLVLTGKPLEVFEQLALSYSISAVYANHDYEPHSIERDLMIADFLNQRNIPFHTFKDQVIFEKSEVLKSDGKPYTIFTPYSKVWKQKVNEAAVKSFPSQDLLKNLYKTKSFHIPTLPEIGFTDIKISNQQPNIDVKIIKEYHETRNFPSLQGTSNLSVHLRFGTVSIRELVQLALKLNEIWLNELIWREFFMMILYHFPYVVNNSFKKKYDQIIWRNNEDEFKRWCMGNTGYPIVDAGMRELNATGFMHNRVRMIVASFLTKHLLIDWRWGEAYFAEKLLDYELSSNNGNWQWSAGCGCDAAPYFRVFNPTEQIKKFDPQFVYINKWVDNLHEKDYPKPMVDHQFARERVLQVFKTALNNF